jgi:hypothetical protein
MGTGSTCGFVPASLSRRHLRGPRRMALSATGRSRLPRAIRGKEVIVRRLGNGVWLELHPKRTTRPRSRRSAPGISKPRPVSKRTYSVIQGFYDKAEIPPSSQFVIDRIRNFLYKRTFT